MCLCVRLCERALERERKRKREGGRQTEKTSRQALKQVRVGVKEHQTAGWRERERARERVNVCAARKREDKKVAKELEGDDRVGAIEY